MTQGRGRLQEFEALRGLSIVLLLILHSEIIGVSAYGITLDPFAQFLASFLLGSFFFLAGYFVDFSMKNSATLFDFIKLRLIRIFPPYWLSLLFFFFLYSLKTIEQIVYIFNVQVIFSPEYVKPLLTLWYISMLILFYLIFSLLIWFIKSNKVLFVFSVIIFFVLYVIHNISGLFDFRVFRYFFIFLAGIYAYRYESVKQYLLNSPKIYKLVFVLISSFGYYYVQVNGFNVISGTYIYFQDLFILSWILVALSIFQTNIGNWKIWIFLSISSYFAYLFHRPIWYFLSLVFDVEVFGGKVIFDAFPGSMIVLIIGYFLQRGYDKLLSVLRLK